MGVAFTLEDYFSGPSDAIERSMSSLEGATAVLEEKINRSLNQIRLGATMVAAGLALLVPIGLGVTAAAEIEQIRVAFDTMLKSAEVGGRVMESLRKFSDVTPFTSDQVFKAGQSMLAYDQNVSKLIPRLRMLGDVAATGVIGLKDLVDIYGKNLLQPYLDRVDILQLAGRGIPIIKSLAEAMGIESGAVLQAATDHKITADVMEKAFQLMTTEGGIYTGMMEKQSETYNGLKSTLQSYFGQMMEALGTPILSSMKDIMKSMIGLAQATKEFLASPLGQSLVKIAAVAGILLVTFGALLMTMGGMRFMAYRMASAFTGSAQAMIIQTLATKGLTAGLRQMAVAAWAAIAPLLPFILIGVAVGAALYGMYKLIVNSIAAFKDMEEAGTGVLGFMQRLGGYITVIKDVWQSWDTLTKTFSLSTDVVAKLTKLGILDNALAIATWVLRIKEFFLGIWAGVTQAWGAIKTFFAQFKPVLGYLESALDYIGINIGKNTSALENWATVGRYVGYALVGILGLVALAMLPIAIAAAVIGVAVLAAVGLIVLAVWGVIELFKLWWAWMGKVWDIATKGYNIGKDFITNLWSGIKDTWSSFKDWLMGAFSSIPGFDMMFNLGAQIGEGIGGMFGGDSPQPQPVPTMRPDAAMQYMGFEGRRMVQSPSAVPGGTNKQPIVIQTNLHLDGKVVADSVNEINDLEDAR